MNKRLCVLASMLLAILWSVTSAEASRRHASHERSQHSTSLFDTPLFGDIDAAPARASRHAGRSGRSGHVSHASRRSRSHSSGGDFFGGSFASMGNLGPRPSQWCGWYMRSRHGGGPEYNLAANWRHYGSASSPHVGAIVVWNHHVGEITGRSSNGQWIVLSGNYSGGVHEGPRSLAGATVRN